MEEWSANAKPDFMSVAFKAEASMEQEQNRSRRSDFPAVVTFHCIMVVAVIVVNISRITVTFLRKPRGANESHIEWIRRIASEIGASVLLSSVSEACCILIGSVFWVQSLAVCQSRLIDYFYHFRCNLRDACCASLRILRGPHPSLGSRGGSVVHRLGL